MCVRSRACICAAIAQCVRSRAGETVSTGGSCCASAESPLVPRRILRRSVSERGGLGDWRWKQMGVGWVVLLVAGYHIKVKYEARSSSVAYEGLLPVDERPRRRTAIPPHYL